MSQPSLIDDLLELLAAYPSSVVAADNATLAFFHPHPPPHKAVILIKNAAEESFFRALGRAIDAFLCPCTVQPVPADEELDTLLKSDIRWILVSETTLVHDKHLLAHFRETPKTGARTLGKIPLLLLPDIAVIHKYPLQKRQIWTLVCRSLKSS